jgi:hypothetical protein
MRFSKRGAVSAVAVFLTVLTVIETTVTTAALAAPAPSTPSTAAVDAVAARTIDLLPASAPVRKVYDNARAFSRTHSEESGPAKERVLTRVKNSIDHGDVVVHLPAGAHLAANDAVVYSGPDATSAAVIPIASVGLAAPSALIVQFGPKSEMTTIERQFQPLGPESGRTSVWLNGSLKVDKVVTNAGQITAPTESVPAETSPAQIQSSFWSRFVDCLNSAGVPSWLITGISIACAAICLVTVGTACPACILGMAGVFIATINACIAQASQG